MRSRVDQLGVTEPVIQTSGGNQISVGLPVGAPNIKRAEQEVGTTARLFFYDWEANVADPDGQAGGQPAADPGPDGDHDQPGTRPRRRRASPGAGSLPLYQAVKLAAAQPYSPVEAQRSRSGSQYFLFGAPGSAACATAARDKHRQVAAGVHCLLAGR